MIRGPVYEFEDVCVDVAAMQVRRGREVLALEPQSFRLLQFLIENRDRVVTKEAIFEAVWEGRAVSDNALTRAVAQLRKVLGDDPRTPRYIDTVPTIGYRFIGELLPECAAAIPVAPPTATPGRMRRFWIPTVLIVAALALGAAAVLHWRGGAKQAPGQWSQLKPVQLTSYPGWVDWPQFSPDGNEIAFEWANNETRSNGDTRGGDDIFVKRLGTDTSPLRLTSDPAPDAWPVWSPDGKTIAFMRLHSLTKADLVLVPSHGGPERKLVELGVWSGSAGVNAAWSRDSKWLVAPGYTDLGVALYRVSVETGQATPIVPPQSGLGYRFPSLSPDGKTLIYVQYPAFNGGKVWSVHVGPDLDAIDAPRQIELGKRLIFQANFTSDSNKMFVRDMNGEAFRVNVDGTGEQEMIPQLTALAHDATMSMRGNRLVWVQRRGNTNLWQLKLKDAGQPAEPPQPLIASPQREVFPQFSPDGRKLSYHAYRGVGDINTWTADADGGNQRQLTHDTAGVTGTAHWSPDGKMLSLDSSSSGTYQVYVMNADGTGRKQITQGAYENFGSSWSHDGKWIYFSSRSTGRHEVWKVSPQGGQPVQVTHNSGWMPTESADGKTLFYCKDVPDATLWSEDLQNGHAEQISNSIYRCNYAVAKQGVYYTTAQSIGDQSQIMFHSFATKHSTLVLQMGAPEYGIAVSPDGRSLAYGQFDNAGSDLMMLEGFK